MPNEATSWTLGIVILIILMFIFFPNLMGGIKDSVLSFGQWAVADPEKPKLSNEMPEDLKTNIDSFFNLLEKNKGGVGGCLLKYGKLDVPKEHSIEFFEYGGGYTGLVSKLQGKVGGFKIDLPVVGGLKPCVVNAENFYNQYLAEIKTDTGQKHQDSGIEIKNDELSFKEKEYDFEQTYVFKSDKEHICFILTHKLDGKWGCSVSRDGYTLDNDCIDEMERSVPLCDTLAKQILDEGKELISDFKMQYSDLKGRYSKYELKDTGVPCILGFFETLDVPEGYQIVIDVKPLQTEDLEKTDFQRKYEIYFAKILDGDLGLTLIAPEPLKPIEDMDFIVSSTSDSFGAITPKIVLTKEKISVYDEDNDKRAGGKLSEIALVIARYNGKNYWSIDNKKNNVKPYCYDVLKN